MSDSERRDDYPPVRPFRAARGTQPDDTAATDRKGTVLTLGSMEVIAVAEDKFWLHDGGPVPSRAEEYDGPPPIPLDQVRRDLPAGWTAERAWYYSPGNDGRITVMPTTIVRSPDGDVLQFLPKTLQRPAGADDGERER